MLPVVSMTSAMSRRWCRSRSPLQSSCASACSLSLIGKARCTSPDADGSSFSACSCLERCAEKRSKFRLSSHAPAVSVPDWVPFEVEAESPSVSPSPSAAGGSPAAIELSDSAEEACSSAGPAGAAPPGSDEPEDPAPGASALPSPAVAILANGALLPAPGALSVPSVSLSLFWLALAQPAKYAAITTTTHSFRLALMCAPPAGLETRRANV